MVPVKFSLPVTLADDIRHVRQMAEKAGYQFDLEDEIAAGLLKLKKRLAAEINGGDQPSESDESEEHDSEDSES